MSEIDQPRAEKKSIEWFVRGILTRIGDTVDRITGRRWTPSSSLATSELCEKLKKLLDIEARDVDGRGKFVPHNIRLKMQWDKFSTDSEDAIKRLENELTIAAIDHINDFRYHTYAPLRVEVKPDYFTEGVQLLVSFDKFDSEKREVAVNVTVPQISVGDYLPEIAAPAEPEVDDSPQGLVAIFSVGGKPERAELAFRPKDRKAVGRSPENELRIDDASVSKMHAAFVFNSERRLLVADTGSTNGTFVNGQRIAYGQAQPVADGDTVRFGNIEVRISLPVPVRLTPASSAEHSAKTVEFGGESLSGMATEHDGRHFLDIKPIATDAPRDGNGGEGTK